MAMRDDDDDQDVFHGQPRRHLVHRSQNLSALIRDKDRFLDPDCPLARKYRSLLNGHCHGRFQRIRSALCEVWQLARSSPDAVADKRT